MAAAGRRKVRDSDVGLEDVEEAWDGGGGSEEEEAWDGGGTSQEEEEAWDSCIAS